MARRNGGVDMNAATVLPSLLQRMHAVILDSPRDCRRPFLAVLLSERPPEPARPPAILLRVKICFVDDSLGRIVGNSTAGQVHEVLEVEKVVLTSCEQNFHWHVRQAAGHGDSNGVGNEKPL